MHSVPETVIKGMLLSPVIPSSTEYVLMLSPCAFFFPVNTDNHNIFKAPFYMTFVGLGFQSYPREMYNNY